MPLKRKKRKRITKQDLKEDRFIILSYTVWAFIQNRIREIVAGALIVVVGVVVLIFFLRSRSTAQQEAARALIPANTAYQNGNYQEATSQYLRILNDYEGTPSAGEAALYLGNANYKLGNYDDAIEAFTIYLDDYGDSAILTVSALSGLGQCYEQKKEYATAIEWYEQIAQKYPTSFLAPVSLTAAARCHVALGNTAQAKALYQRIIDQYGNSREAQEAKTALAML